jgi:integrating conjugative element protein (TIGR03756 family)
MIKLFLFILIIIFNVPVWSEDSVDIINPAQIVGATLKGMNSNCLKYKWTNKVCVWVSPVVGKNFTPVVEHYLPDLIVVVFPSPGKNPLLQARPLDYLGEGFDNTVVNIAEHKNIPAGYGNQTFLDEHDQSIIFKEVDVIGNPSASLLSLLPNFILLPTTLDIKSNLISYYSSLFDSQLWRGLPPRSLLEESAAGMGLLALLHKVGSGDTNWGGVYPHEGKVIGLDDYKASSVIAQRAADLVTGSNTYLHVRRSLSSRCGQKCKAEPIEENSENTYFQLVYPISDEYAEMKNQCFKLGDKGSSAAQFENPKGSYIWIVWRLYKGCADGHGMYAGTI